jgi:hypothetical protein
MMPTLMPSLHSRLINQQCQEAAFEHFNPFGSEAATTGEIFAR